MSADHWSKCPRCITRANAEYEEKAAYLANEAYGSLSSEDFLALAAEVRDLATKCGDPNKDLYGEEWPLAHYYEFYIRDGAVNYNYHCTCRECGWEVQFEGKHDFTLE